ncbi:bacteriohemerythrin [Treponema pedis]|nr:hemerythrin family protein [Treponema pedis]QOW59950.1 hemerythrin family protein [Treponema pedis]QSI05292.1 hemerythrin [Treponema pedis]
MKKINEYVWDDSLSVGYTCIDLHHKKLLLIIKDFASLLKCSQKEYSLNIGKVLKELSDYTKYHFCEEEKIISKYKCPFFEQHAKIHEEFISKINENLKILASGDMDAGIEFYNFLGKWLLEHIAAKDHRWSDYVHENYPNEKF